MNMPLVLLNRRRRGGAAAFTPAGLFALAEPGVWYDPSDLTTLFQDTAGTTPVTTPGQTVALALDKSKGLVLGSELVTNGTFDTNVTGWSASGAGASIVWSNGSMQVSGVSSFEGATQSLTLTAGRTYLLSCNYVRGSASQVRLAAQGFSGQPTVTGTASSGTLRVIAVAASTNVVRVDIGSGLAGDFFVDNISVKELPGFHATQATLASRPTYQVISGRPCLVFDGVDDFLITPTITPGIDKAQVFAGVRKLSDAAVGMLAEFGPTVNVTAGTWGHILPDTTSAGSLGLDLRGNGTSGVQRVSTGTAPATFVSATAFDLSGTTFDTERPVKRINGAAATVLSSAGSTDTGGGNFTAQALYIGRRGGTTLPFNGNLFSLIVRFGTNLDAGTITSTETWVNGKTGAYA